MPDNWPIEAHIGAFDGYGWYTKGTVTADCFLVIGQHILDGAFIDQGGLYNAGVKISLFCRSLDDRDISDALPASMLCRSQRQVQPLHGGVTTLAACKCQCAMGSPGTVLLKIRCDALFAVHHFQAEEAPGDIYRANLAHFAHPQSRAPGQRACRVKVEIDTGGGGLSCGRCVVTFLYYGFFAHFYGTSFFEVYGNSIRCIIGKCQGIYARACFQAVGLFHMPAWFLLIFQV